jgi:hypothetical protein
MSDTKKMGEIMVTGCEFHYATLVTPEAFKPGEMPAWSIQVRTYDKDERTVWKNLGLNVKIEEPEEGPIFYKFNVYKKLRNSKDVEQPAPEVLGSKLEPIDASRVGNGSKGNLILFWYINDGKKYFQLRKVQITEWVDYKYEREEAMMFEALDDDTVVVEVEDTGGEALGDDEIPF